MEEPGERELGLASLTVNGQTTSFEYTAGGRLVRKYVNPVVAVLLGWAILDEPVSVRTFAAMGLILGAVVWIQVSHKLAGGRALKDSLPVAGGQLVSREPPPVTARPQDRLTAQS